ncbi:transcriptional regulator, TetR family [Actinopolyspora mzabensis]|uniref:Transcriptional regulator, TetR family n=1 Tax=Actinopolyspora mzabensis TaxID=995066 RepID=A0A1G9EPI2_ACTMZ|nr:TetR/AcrR family transcriptional regulator [Actinopolyspora mzabensis]SDK77973.1 transcriptional regulator, TetR family [Actinopolyspora mzabensis]
MSGSLRQRQKDDRRLRMIHAALELFDEYGFSEVGVADIAERIGMSYRTIYRYFPSKEDVLLGLVIEGNHTFLDRVDERLGEEPLLVTFADAMTEALEELSERVGEDAIRRMSAQIDRVESVRARALLHSADMRDRLAALVERHPAYAPERYSEIHLAVEVFGAVSAEAQRRWRSVPPGSSSLAGEFRAVMAGLPTVVPDSPQGVD